MTQPGQPAHQLPRPGIKGLARQVGDLRRRVEQLHGMAVKAINIATLATPAIVTKQVDDTSAWSTPGTWGTRLSTSVAVPNGFTSANVLIGVSAGCTFNDSSGTGIIGVCPQVNGTDGPAISNGASYPVSQACSVSSFQAINVSGLSGGESLTLAALGYRVESISGTENVHLSAVVSFYR